MADTLEQRIAKLTAQKKKRDDLANAKKAVDDAKKAYAKIRGK